MIVPEPIPITETREARAKVQEVLADRFPKAQVFPGPVLGQEERGEGKARVTSVVWTFTAALQPGAKGTQISCDRDGFVTGLPLREVSGE